MKFLSLFLVFFSLHSSASLVGVSTHPLNKGENIINSEFVNHLGADQSYGVQVKFLHKFSSKLNFDGGFRVLKSDFSSLLLSGTYEVFPDYQYQPQISLKAFYEFENFSTSPRNHLGIAPVIGKGFSFWGVPAFPYVSATAGLRMDYDSSEIDFVSSMIFGVSGKIPYESLSNMIANFETNLDLVNSSTSVSMGVSLKFQ